MPDPTSEKLPASQAAFGVPRSLTWGGILILLGIMACVYLLRTAPATVPGAEVHKVDIVQTRVLEPQNHRIRVLGYGEVIPAREVILSSEVSGRVVRQHAGLVPGGYIGAGEEILGIDDADYQITLSEQQAALAEAESELQLEQGRQVVAAREWEQLKNEMPEVEVNQDLVLRMPHRRKMEAIIERSRTLIDRAELALKRTSLKAPFNALVLEESVEMGQLVNVGDTVATLAGADEFWVQTSVRQHELPHIRTSANGPPGAPATITLETGASGVVYQGTVLRLLSDLEPNGRNARVIVSVDDPLGLHPGGGSEDTSLPLLLRSFVRVEIDAGELRSAIALERSLLREGNQVWVMDRDETLQIRQAEVVWDQDDLVYIADTLNPGDELVVSKLRSVVPGTPVQAKRRES